MTNAWFGQVQASAAGTYQFSVTTTSATAVLTIDGVNVDPAGASVVFGAGSFHDVSLLVVTTDVNGSAALDWKAPDSPAFVPIPTGSLYPPTAGAGSGLLATYYSEYGLTGTNTTETDARVDFMTAPAPSASWLGEIQPYTDGIYSLTFGGGAAVDGRIWVNDQLAYDCMSGADAPTTYAIPLKGGQRYDIKVETLDDYAGPQLVWSSETQPAEVVPSSQLYPTTGFTPIAIGPTSADPTGSYTLALSATGDGASGIDHWLVDWGDGISQQYSATSTSVTHLYASRNATYPIAVSAVLADGSSKPAAFYTTTPTTVTAVDSSWVTLATHRGSDGDLAIAGVDAGSTDSSGIYSQTLTIIHLNSAGVLDTSFGAGGVVTATFHHAIDAVQFTNNLSYYVLSHYYEYRSTYDPRFHHYLEQRRATFAVNCYSIDGSPGSSFGMEGVVAETSDWGPSFGAVSGDAFQGPAWLLALNTDGTSYYPVVAGPWVASGRVAATLFEFDSDGTCMTSTSLDEQSTSGDAGPGTDVNALSATGMAITAAVDRNTLVYVDPSGDFSSTYVENGVDAIASTQNSAGNWLIITAGTNNGDMVFNEYNSDFSVASGFGTDGAASAGASGVSAVTGISVLPDGRILAQGTTCGSGEEGATVLVRLLPDGSVDDTWGVGGSLISAFGADASVALNADDSVSLVAAQNGSLSLTNFAATNTIGATAYDSSVTLVAAAPSPTEVDLSYYAPAGMALSLEAMGPADYNYQTVGDLPSGGDSGAPLTYGLTGLSAGAHYQFRIRAVDPTTGTVQYATAFADTPATSPALVAPTGLTQGETNSEGQVAIGFTWDPTTDGNSPSTFNVTVRSYSSAEPSPLFNVHATTTDQTFEFSATPTTGNYYIVQHAFPAFDDEAMIQISDGTSISPWVPVFLSGVQSPPQQAKVAMSASAATDGSVNVTFGRPFVGQVYGISTSTSGGSQALQLVSLATISTPQSSVNLPATTLTNDNILQIVAFDGSNYSTPVSVPTQSIAAPPTPSGFSVTSIGTQSAALSWDNNSDVETSYVVQRIDDSQVGSSWQTIATLSSDQSSIVDTVPSSSDVYGYQVLAVGAGGQSAPTASQLAWFAPLTSDIASSSNSIQLGDSVTLSATATASNGGADALSYLWTLTPSTGGTPTTVTTSSPSLAFTPTIAASWSATLTVTDTQLNLHTTTSAVVVSVSTTTPLRISGPSLAAEGDILPFTEVGATGTAQWSVTLNGSTVATGLGSSFSFTPGDSGPYQVTVSDTGTGGTGLTTSSAVVVTHVAPKVTIDGSASGAVGKSMVFSAAVNRSASDTDPLSYTWSVKNADGTPYYWSGSTGPVRSDLSTYVVPGNLPAGSYTVTLLLGDTHDGVLSTVTSTLAITLATSAQDTSVNWAAAAIAKGLPSGDNNFQFQPGAVVQQPDGKIIVAGIGYANHPGVSLRETTTDDNNSTVLARFNPDLTLDPTFGPDHTGMVSIDYGYVLPNGAELLTWSIISAIAIDPFNGDIVIAGSTRVRDTTSGLLVDSGIAVAEYVGSDRTTANGQMLLAGTPDPDFNDGRAFVQFSDQTASEADSIAFASNGSGTAPSILIGGAVLALEGTGGSPTGALSDYVLMKILPNGSADPSFNPNQYGYGIAQYPTTEALLDDSSQEYSGLRYFHQTDPYAGANLPYGASLRDKVFQSVISVGGASGTGPGASIIAGGQSYNPDIPLGDETSSDFGLNIVRYNSDGTLDTSFGDNGVAFVSSEALNGPMTDPTVDGFVSLSSLSLVNVGGVAMILAVGLADSWTTIRADGNSATVFLARFNLSNGSLDTTFGDGGILRTDVLEAGIYQGGPDYGPYSPGSRTSIPAVPVSFTAGGQILTSIMTPPASDGTQQWNAVQIDPTTGSATVIKTFSPPAADSLPGQNATTWTLQPSAQPASILCSGGQLLAVGRLLGSTPDVGSGVAQVQSLPFVAETSSGPTPSATGLAASQSPGSGVDLAWTNSGIGQEGFYIYRSTSTASGPVESTANLIGAVDADSRSFSDATALAGNTYVYQVVPFYTDSSGVQQTAGATTTASVVLPPAGAGQTLKETLLVPLDGSSVTSSTILDPTQTYAITASGKIHLNADYTVDAEGWQSLADPSFYGSHFASVTTGIALQSGAGATAVVPNWGLPATNQTSSSYTYVMKGTGAALSVSLSAASFAGDYVGSGDQPLEVQVYQLNAPGGSSASSSGNVRVQSQNTLISSVQVPFQTATGGTSPSVTLPVGGRYLIQASGSFVVQDPSRLNWDGSHQSIIGDAASWTIPASDLGQSAQTSEFMDTYGGDRYGLWINDGTTNAAPIWGLPQTSTHVYSTVISGTGQTLTFTFNSVDPLTSPGSITVNVYAIGTPQLVSTAASPAVMSIALPTTPALAQSALVDQSVPVDVLSARPDGGTAPWGLWLGSADPTEQSSAGAWTFIAGNATGSGALPNVPAAAATLNPALYPNGAYVLRLNTSTSNPLVAASDQESITVWTAAKSGAFTLPVTSAVVNTVVGPTKVSQTYNSSRASVPGLLGPGWTFDMLDTQMSSTARPGTFNPLNHDNVLRSGDLISFTVPNDGQHVFEFDPIPINGTTWSQSSSSSQEYLPRFVAVDGSGATLSFPAPWENTVLGYSAIDDEFYSLYEAGGYPSVEGGLYNTHLSIDPTQTDGDGNPATGEGDQLAFGGEYDLTTRDGTSYAINATNGLIKSVTDPSGNSTTYRYSIDPFTGQEVISADGQDQASMTITASPVGAGGKLQVTSVAVAGQAPIIYKYSANGLLQSVTDQSGNVTRYAYQATGAPLLTAVISPSGTTQLQVQYAANGQLSAIVNSSGDRVPVASGSLGGASVIQTMADAAGDVTQYVFDERYGTTLRTITDVLASDGTVSGYNVSANQFAYGETTRGNAGLSRATDVVQLQSVETFASFSVSGVDPSGSRYVLQPDPSTLDTTTSFDTSDDINDTARGQIVSTSQRLDASGRLQVTQLSDFTVSANGSVIPQPMMTSVYIETVDTGVSSGYDSVLQSRTFNLYDDHGRAVETIKQLTNSADGTLTWGEGTESLYDSFGLLTNKWNIVASWDASTVPTAASQFTITQEGQTQVNGYYLSQGSPGQVFGAKEYSIDAAAQETYYAYDSSGRVVVSAVYKTWTDSSGNVTNGWVGTTSVYNSRGVLTDEYEASYYGNGATGDDGVPAPTFVASPSTNSSSGSWTGISSGLLATASTYTGAVVDISNEMVPGTLVHVEHINYNSLGLEGSSIDQLGGVTSTTYDAQGHTLRTVSPNGTEVRNVYDALGRVIWTTQSFVPTNADPTSPANVANATQTVYDSQGNVIATNVYTGVAIEILTVKSGSVTSSISVAVGGSLVSTNKTWYDEQGNAIETLDTATGLRTGTTYYPDGSVQSTGPLLSSAPDGGEATTVGGMTTHAFIPSDFAYTLSSLYQQYDSSLSAFYSTSTDGDGHSTRTYTDMEGRTVLTVYANGTSTQNLYGVGTSAVCGHTVDGQVITGYQETEIDQLGRATDYFYDLDGRLTDVYQPPVATGQVEPLTGTDPTTGDPIYSSTPETNLSWLLTVSADGAAGSSPAPYQEVFDRPHTTSVYDTAGNEVLQVTADEQAAYALWRSQIASGETTAPFTGGTSFGFDDHGNQVTQTLPDGETEWTQYNKFSQKVLSSDFDGNETAYVYDDTPAGAGKVTAEYVFASGVSPFSGTTIRSAQASMATVLTYDSMGRTALVDDYVNNGLSRATGYTYDPVSGQVASVTAPEGTIAYSYDPAGRLTSTSTGNTVTNYGYNALSEMTSVSLAKADGTVLSSPLTTRFSFDNAGNNTSEILPNGVTSTYTFDSVNQLTDLVTTETVSGTGVTLLAEHYTLLADGTRSHLAQSQLLANGTQSATNTTWQYDSLGRLTLELQSGTTTFGRAYAYDMEGNILGSASATATGSLSNEVAYAYNGDNELLSQTVFQTGTTTVVSSTTNSYDANGSLTASTVSTTGSASAPTITLYTYNAKNKLASVSTNGAATASYTYDDAGNRVGEVNGGGSSAVTTKYLTDTLNPSGHAQPVEVSTVSSTGGWSLNTTYILGDRVIGQVGSSAASARYFEMDGHGSTVGLLDPSGNVAATYAFDGFGDAVGFDPTSAATVFLFGGDAMYDAATGLYLHGDGTRARLGFDFIQRDTFAGTTNDPVSLHKYLYAGASPVNYNDPSGHDIDWAGDAQSVTVTVAVAGAQWLIADTIGPALIAFDGVIAGLNNMAMAGPDVNPAGAFAVGFISGAAEEALSLLGLPCWVDSAVGGAILAGGNSYLETGEFSLETVGAAAVGGLIAGLVSKLSGAGCFVAGTLVLLGDGTTKEAINDIRVGQRVKTDGGAANSPDGKTAATDPNATAVDPKTWREVTITTSDGNWEVESLQPISEIRQLGEKAGGKIDLSNIVDLADMGAEEGLTGTVTEITACPEVQSGPGRVVLTTVNHLNNDVYDLELTDSSGEADDLGVTAAHRFYDNSTSQWVHTADLYVGEMLRGDHGDLTVTHLTFTPGTDRVYNMTVEADHVYYVGDLSTLTHNNCKWKDGNHHIEPTYLRGQQGGPTAYLSGAHHGALHSTLDEVLQEWFGDAVSSFARSGKKWQAFFAQNPGAQDEALMLARGVFQKYFG